MGDVIEVTMYSNPIVVDQYAAPVQITQASGPIAIEIEGAEPSLVTLTAIGATGATGPQSVYAYANQAAFPGTGAANTIYVDNATDHLFRWTGSAYEQVGGSSGGTGRTLLTSNTTYYVSTTGNNTTGDGTAGNPWLTIGHAWNYICTNIDIGSKTVTIQLATAGTYSGGFSSYGIVDASPDNSYNNAYVPTGGGQITIRGDPADQDNYIIQSAPSSNSSVFDIGHEINSFVYVNGVQLKGDYSCDIYGSNCIFYFINCTIKDENYGAIFAEGGNRVSFVNGRLSGVIATAPFYAYGGGSAIFLNGSLDVSGVTSLPGAIYAAYLGGNIRSQLYGGVTGTMACPSYELSGNSILLQVNTLPGSGGGTILSGARVVNYSGTQLAP